MVTPPGVTIFIYGQRGKDRCRNKSMRFDELATREGFNRSLKHFKFISRVIGEFESKRNIADILSDCLADKSIEPRQVLPTLNAILVDKYHYACRSHNLSESFDAFDGLAATVGGWRAVDMVVTYFHPELGVVVVNPKNRAHWETVRTLEEERACHRFRRRLLWNQRRQEIRFSDCPADYPD